LSDCTFLFHDLSGGSFLLESFGDPTTASATLPRCGPRVQPQQGIAGDSVDTLINSCWLLGSAELGSLTPGIEQCSTLSPPSLTDDDRLPKEEAHRIEREESPG
jgi:hypothetical protein